MEGLLWQKLNVDLSLIKPHLTDREKVYLYAGLGSNPPPVIVELRKRRDIDGEMRLVFHLIDGAHRIEAERLKGKKQLDVFFGVSPELLSELKQDSFLGAA